MRMSARSVLGAFAALALGCGAMELGPVADGEGEEDDLDSRNSVQQGQLELNFLYVHGVKNCRDQRQNAQNSLTDLEAAVRAELPARIQAYQNSHPGVTIATRSARANLYTAAHSGRNPSDSTDPINMDDWEVGDPGCSTSRQGDPCTTAHEWRHRLVQEIHRHFPANAKNIILIGHSTGGRTAFEVAANVGSGGVGSFNWGVQNRIAGVVSIHGMIDSLGTNKYDVVGPASFVSTCKNSDILTGFGDGCAQGNGWCEYAGNVAGFDAADWTAQNKQALMLISAASCSPSLFSLQTDGALPLDAQGSPKAVGTETTPGPGDTVRPAHGVKYGSFCHSAITSRSNAGHDASVAAAKGRILDWLFTSASRVAAAGTINTSAIAPNASTPTFPIGSTCPSGHADGGQRIVGTCRHPGFFDGNDHAVASSEIAATNGPTCNGSFKWTQRHDSNNNHAAAFWWKTYSVPTGAGLVESLPTN